MNKRNAFFYGRGTEAGWDGDTLVLGPSKERRGGGQLFHGQSHFAIRHRLYWQNGFVKDGGGVYLYDCHDVQILDNLFLANVAKWGGGLYLERCTNVVISHNWFVLNGAIRDGGAMSISESRDIVVGLNHFLLNWALRTGPECDIHRSEVSSDRH